MTEKRKVRIGRLTTVGQVAGGARTTVQTGSTWRCGRR